MYLWLKLQKESREYWEEHFNDSGNPWTAEFAFGWRLKHRPIMTLFALAELMIECLGVIFLCVIYSR